MLSLSKHKISAITNSLCRSLHQNHVDDFFQEHHATKYPPIVLQTTEGRKKHARHMFYDSIKDLPTSEQKLYELSIQARLREMRFLVAAVSNTYNGIFFRQYITRTHVVNELPDIFSEINVDEEYNEVSQVFKDTVSSYFMNNWKSTDETYSDVLCSKRNSAKLVNLLVLQCFKKMASRNDYILKSTIQQSPTLKSFWFHGGFYSKNNNLWEENLTFQYRDSPAFVVRIRHPLNPILKLDDPLCASADVPDYNFLPRTVGISCDRKRLASLPGYWFDDPCEYPFLQVRTTDGLSKLLDKTQYADVEKIKESVAVTSSFGWLNAVATYQGFTPYHDLTYPLVNQTIITNGQDWNFYVYQLNTIAFHADVDKKDRRNICWSSGKIRLFDAIEDGKIKGLNEDVFKILLKFLMSVPMLDENVVLKPYEGVDNRTDLDILTMRHFQRKYYYPERPSKIAFRYEVPTWHKIYLPKYNKLAKHCPFIKLY